jgi:DNA invertase Pin-like site-specific DNA recombinase
MSRVAIYVRVSTIGQTTENQLRELRAVAKREGHKVVAEFTDNGISGAKNREARPGLNSLLEGVTRREFDKVRTPRDPAMQACTAAAGSTPST